jgi:hypothetical protein
MLKFYQNHDTQTGSFWQSAPFVFDKQSNIYVFSSLSKYNLPIGYGAVNALSGDHSENPLKLQEAILTLNSKLLKIINLHNEYTKAFYSAAPDNKLSKLDANYAMLAAKNISHFYRYGKGIKQHLTAFDPNEIEKLINPILATSSFKKLNSSNAINIYVTIHTTAIYLAELAGSEINETKAKQLLYYAFLYNGFGDHFLEDAFSSGHLLVKRKMLHSITNNKALHDFYSKQGAQVININGEIWRAFGDNFLNHYHNNYLNDSLISNIDYPKETDDTRRIINAVAISISDIKEAYDRGQKNPINPHSSYKKIPPGEDERLTYFVANYKALQLIPLPYNSDLSKVMTENLYKRKDIKINNQLPYLRNFIRSRVANSIILGVTNNSFINGSNYFQGLDIRLNAGLLKTSYRSNAEGDKKGALDTWHGYTFSYTFGDIIEENILSKTRILKAGIRSNFDYWLSNKRFAGLFAYNEIGLERINNRLTFVYVPQIGIQLGSLLNINYYNMPPWLRIPAQLILPLKYKIGCVFSTEQTPAYFSGVEIDLVF